MCRPATCNVCGGPTGTSLLACEPCLLAEGRVITDLERVTGATTWSLTGERTD